jgi:hypothetical protein
VKLAQVLLQLGFQVPSGLVLVLLLDRLPLVNNNHHRPPFSNRAIDELEVVDSEGGKGVHDVDYDVGLLDVEHGADL